MEVGFFVYTRDETRIAHCTHATRLRPTLKAAMGAGTHFKTRTVGFYLWWNPTAEIDSPRAHHFPPTQTTGASIIKNGRIFRDNSFCTLKTP
ncbi:hypothetical protein GBA52_022480 [Prunus armeniaca]|nr:hypothetical protein GBA52_022480 [Prunus armeniaca]